MEPPNRSARGLRYFWFLLALGVLLIVSPLAESFGFKGLGLAVLFTVLILSAVRAASDQRRHLLIAISLALPALAFNWISMISGAVSARTVADLIYIVLLVFTFFIMLRHIFILKEVGFDVICGAVAVYLLIGVVWALSYRLLESLVPGSFELSEPSGEFAWSQFIYFSLTTLTTLGYGDITPVSPFSRIWSTLEAVTGVLYLAVLVARLVSLYRD